MEKTQVVDAEPEMTDDEKIRVAAAAVMNVLKACKRSGVHIKVSGGAKSPYSVVATIV